MENPEEEEIDGKYIIKEKKGSGGTANAFLVTQKGHNTEYIAKVLKKDDKDTRTYYNNEIKYLTIFKEDNNPNVIRIIDNGEGPVIRRNRNNGQPLIKKYIIVENAPHRELADFIIYTNSGLGEFKSKAFFYKIVKAIQSIHQKGICHRDIKMENILLIENFTPKIGDFGNAIENKPNLNFYFGSRPYVAPEILKNVPYDGFAVDVFSLGVTLIYLTIGFPGFAEASKRCEYYKKIILNDRKGYLEMLKPFIKEELSEEFKDLYFKMVAVKPGDRPSIQDILDHPWFKSYLEMNDEQKKNLDDQIKAEFEGRIEKIKDRITNEIEESNMQSEDIITRSSNEEYNYFKPDLKPKKVPESFDTSFCIKIKGYVDPCKFMNHFCGKMIEEFKEENCFVEADKNKLKINVIFEEEEERDEENETIKGNGITIKIKLYQSNDALLLKLFKVEGNTKDFFDKFVAISKIVKNCF